MNVKEEFLARGKFKVGNGMHTTFWEESWLGDKPLAEQYPNLYNIIHHKNVTISIVLGSVPLNISFQRNLLGNTWEGGCT
jgi:hypothetical protein